MLLLSSVIFLVAQAQVDAGTCVTNELLSKLESHTNLTSFKGKYEVTYADHSNGRNGVEVQEYRFSGENTYQLMNWKDPGADGTRHVLRQAFFQGKVTHRFDAEASDGRALAEFGHTPEYNAALSGGWVSSWGIDPRRIMGSIGRNAGNDQMDIFGVSLSAFLRSPGPLVCFQRPPYLIVAHRAKVGLGEICADIWLDTSADMDVARIDEVVRDFESPPDIVRKFYGGELLDLRIVTKSLELFGYMDIGNGARFPASASLKTFQGEAANQELMEGFFQAGHSRPEANVLFIIRASYPLSCEATMKILPDKCLFNTPLGDSEFRLTFSEGATVFTDAADPTQHYEVKRAWYQRSGITLPLLLLFIGVPVLCFVGRRYLGWK